MGETLKPTGEQAISTHDALEAKKGKADHLAPWQYRKGQSGNPAGRAKGISLKEYAKMKLLHMTDEEREEFFNGLSKDTIWEMAEGRAQTNTDLTTKGESLAPILVKFIDGTTKND